MMYCHKGHEMGIMTSLPPKNAKCYACARSSSESEEAVYYNCTDCDVVIHRKCAQLPKQIDHPMHPEHPLLLLAKPPYESETCECQGCKKSWENFVYHCSSCKFNIDILCAFLEEDIKISTHHHPVRLIRRPASFKCNACDVEEKDNESYTCTKPSCWFWIHKKCGALPETFRHSDHVHPLLLATSVPVRYHKYNFTCELCHWNLGINAWIYYCQKCKYFIHIKCVGARVPPYRLTFGHPLKFEMIRELQTVMAHTLPFNYRWKETHLHSKYIEQDDTQLPEVKVNVDCHNHWLVLNSHSHSHQDDHEFICDGCIEPINHASSPYFKCGQYCNFFLHTTCATLPKNREVVEKGLLRNGVYTELKLYFPENPWEVVKCKACCSFCNGYTYKFNENGCDFYLDIKCCYLIGDILHIGHIHNLSAMLYWRSGASYSTFTCGGCGDYYSGPHFYCQPCRFYIGYECATLPATVKHRWDKHPLILCFPPVFRDTDEGDEFYCEVCEEEIHPKHWMYRCAECDHSFHPRCIPTLGESRNIKFGKTVSVQSHPHHLTLVPQANLTSLCHTCRKSLYWSRCFECAACGFYICPECIPKEVVTME